MNRATAIACLPFVVTNLGYICTLLDIKKHRLQHNKLYWLISLILDRFMLFLDVGDIVLDFLFCYKLWETSQAWSIILIVTTCIGFGLSRLVTESRTEFVARWFLGDVDDELQLCKIAVELLLGFTLEDTTLIFIFIFVDDAYDPNDTLTVISLSISIAIGSIAILILFLHVLGDRTTHYMDMYMEGWESQHQHLNCIETILWGLMYIIAVFPVIAIASFCRGLIDAFKRSLLFLPLHYIFVVGIVIMVRGEGGTDSFATAVVVIAVICYVISLLYVMIACIIFEKRKRDENRRMYELFLAEMKKHRGEGGIWDLFLAEIDKRGGEERMYEHFLATMGKRRETFSRTQINLQNMG